MPRERGPILIRKKGRGLLPAPQSKTRSIALFHSHHENDVRGAVRQVDPELIGVACRQVGGCHVENPLLPGRIPAERCVWDVTTGAFVDGINRAPYSAQHGQRASGASEDCSRTRDGSTRRAAHPELHRNRASTFAWIDAGSVAVDRRQNDATWTNGGTACAEGDVNRRTNWTASKVIGITCVTRTRSVGSGIERRSRTPGVVGNRDGLIQSSRPSHIRGQSARDRRR